MNRQRYLRLTNQVGDSFSTNQRRRIGHMIKNRFLLSLLLLLLFARNPHALAQGEMAMPSSEMTEHDGMQANQMQMPMQHSQDMENPHPMMTPPAASDDETSDDQMMAPMTLDLTANSPDELMMLNMRRQGSGTSWQPVDNPMMMKMWDRQGSWMTMLHWNAFLDYDHQGGPRGRDKLVGQNWIMGSAARPIGEKGMLQLRGMLSGDPFTVGKTGYPLLFQEGEAVNGMPLIDFQHPHDLFMELSAQYWHRFSQNTWGFLYGAPVGEPALGPVAVPHRYSALLNPEASLSHHIQDSTHIAFGVLTAGLVHKKWQFETSLFNGREPDDNRYDFDYNPFRLAYSGRISYMPNQNWAFQVSHGHLNDPEELESGTIDRSTASASYTKTWNTGWLATSLIAGHNFESGPDDNGITLESTWNFKERNYLFGRVENVQRHGLLVTAPEADFNITAFTLGVARDLLRWRGIPLTLGAQISLYVKPSSLDPAYGDFPLSFHIFLHTNAPRHQMAMNHQGH